MTAVYLLLGTNMGDRLQHLEDACVLLSALKGNDGQPVLGSSKDVPGIFTKSPIYETAAWGKIEQADYLNQAVAFSTALDPWKLLEATSAIESQLGRVRRKVWEPRIIDIDILFYGSQIIREDRLVIPHPHLQDRRFVLQPLSDIAPSFVHPVLKKTICTLLKQCKDPLWVRKYS
jgi:2-amino-4-hydroxy-6-hydroxymethyldihydropteridine diphosphokinase